MKLHRHVVPCGGRSYTVITLRPGTCARFSGNYHHGTWHILSDLHGAQVLARLLWGLAYQRVPGTLVLIDRPQLDPEPFSAEPADPIALVPSELTSLPDRAAREIRACLPLTRSAGTVRWQTPGLDVALAKHGTAAWNIQADNWRHADRPGDSRISRTGGLVVFAGLPHVLKRWAVEVARLGSFLSPHGMDYVYLGHGSCRADGEVQVFTDYRQRVSAARVGRREVLAEIPQPLPPADTEKLIWDRGTAIRQHRHPHPVQAGQAGQARQTGQAGQAGQKGQAGQTGQTGQTGQDDASQRWAAC
jgi:hypothetical protein